MEAFLDLNVFAGLFQICGWLVQSLFAGGTAFKNDDVPSDTYLNTFKNLVVLGHFREIEELRTNFWVTNFRIWTTNSASFQQSLSNLMGLKIVNQVMLFQELLAIVSLNEKLEDVFEIVRDIVSAYAVWDLELLKCLFYFWRYFGFLRYFFLFFLFII